MSTGDFPPLANVASFTDDDHANVVSLIEDMAVESRDDAQDWLTMADKCINIKVWGNEDGTDDDELVINDISNVVDAITDVQTKEAVQVSLEGRETAETPEVYWTGPDDVAAQLSPLVGLPLTPGLLLPPQLGATLTNAGEEGQLILGPAPMAEP